jgi:hypothetical protein
LIESKQNKRKKNMKNKNETVQRGVGRPKYVPQFPRKDKWTFADYCTTNGVAVDGKDKGKGSRCSALTLRKTLGYDAVLGDSSMIVKLENQFGKPDSESGLGKPPSLFAKRAIAMEKGWEFAPAAKPLKSKAKAKKAVKSKAKAKKAVKSKAKVPSVNVPITNATAPAPAPVSDAVSPETKEYEALKEQLLATPVPVVEISTPAAEPVAETPAPAAEVATAEVAAS